MEANTVVKAVSSKGAGVLPVEFSEGAPSGVAVRLPGGWGRRAPAKPANGATTDSDPAKPAITVQPDPTTPSCKENQETAKPVIGVAAFRVYFNGSFALSDSLLHFAQDAKGRTEKYMDFRCWAESDGLDVKLDSKVVVT